tara:strand:- start:24 stop:1019 length:996 start_codon:yes stop_codon:yes gene_type:complete
MATATNQDILEAYQQSVGAGEGQVNTQLLIQALRDRQKRAVEEDAMFAKKIQSGGKAGLNVLKARRDFLLAKRANPNLKFTQFMSDPKTAGKYMEQGASSIASGKSPAIGLKETFNPFSKNYARNLNVERSNESLEMLNNLRSGATPSAEASMLPNQPLGEMPGFDDFSNLPSPPPPPAMGDVSSKGLSALLKKGQTPIVPQVTTQYASPSQVASMTKANPIQMQAVDAVPSPLQGIRRGASSLGLDNIEKVPVPDPTAGASQGAGMAGKALGSLGGVLQTLKGAKGMAKEGANIGNVSQSLGGMATLAGLGPIGLGLGLLGGIASLRRRK